MHPHLLVSHLYSLKYHFNLRLSMFQNGRFSSVSFTTASLTLEINVTWKQFSRIHSRFTWVTQPELRLRGTEGMFGGNNHPSSGNDALTTTCLHPNTGPQVFIPALYTGSIRCVHYRLH